MRRRVWGAAALGALLVNLPACARQGGAVAPEQKAAQSAPSQDESLLKQLEEINARTMQIKDLSAEFEQRKFTPLLKAPLVSTGTVRVKGPLVKWDTDKPEPSVMRIDETELRVLYPAQKVMEVYPIGEDLRQLSSSPLPRLSVMRKQYSFARMDAKELDGGADASKVLAVVMTPTVEALREHIRTIRVLIDIAGGFATRMELTDPDGERTQIVFSKVRTNTGLTERDLALEAPAGVTVSRPLSGAPAGGKPSGEKR